MLDGSAELPAISILSILNIDKPFFFASLESQIAALETVEGPVGAPLNASPWNAFTSVPVSSKEGPGSTAALQMALSLISMASPRNLQPQRAALAPSFVEFDMAMEGYGYEKIICMWNMLGKISR